MRYPFKSRQLKEMGKRLRTVRESQNITQTELARRIFKSKQTISAYELGNSEMPASSLAALSGALNCNVDFIVVGQTKSDRSTSSVSAN